jgi:hypothetical protein
MDAPRAASRPSAVTSHRRGWVGSSRSQSACPRAKRMPATTATSANRHSRLRVPRALRVARAEVATTHSHTPEAVIRPYLQSHDSHAFRASSDAVAIQFLWPQPQDVMNRESMPLTIEPPSVSPRTRCAFHVRGAANGLGHPLRHLAPIAVALTCASFRATVHVDLLVRAQASPTRAHRSGYTWLRFATEREDAFRDEVELVDAVRDRGTGRGRVELAPRFTCTGCEPLSMRRLRSASRSCP